MPLFDHASIIHGVCRLVGQVDIVAAIYLKLLAIHGLLRMGQLELGRSLQARRGHFLPEGRLREISVGWQGPIQAIGKSSALIRVLVP